MATTYTDISDEGSTSAACSAAAAAASPRGFRRRAVGIVLQFHTPKHLKVKDKCENEIKLDIF